MWAPLKNAARDRHEQFDRQIAAGWEHYLGQGGRIFCGKGCRNCCTLTVNAAFSEALAVAEALSGPQQEALDGYVSRLRGLVPTLGDLKTYLRMQRLHLGDCPFLDPDGSCGIYPRRPFACRALLATRPADWCGVDFSTLSALDKQLFLAGLDRTAVDFPTHYLAAPRDLGQQLEAETLTEMADACGFSLSGNLPYLVWLERSHNLSTVIATGREATMNLLRREKLALPFVIDIGA